ncbi:MAG: J domain-containing protein [Phormidesmis sp.]
MTEAIPGSEAGNVQSLKPAEQRPNYYELLGLRRGASVQDIRRAYRDLSKLYHPDTTELESVIAIPKFQALNEAYATLSSPEKRLTYDYRIGYSRLSVMQVNRDPNAQSKQYASNAYLSPSDRPLSAGELFALFILGVTFVGCLLLVVTISLTKGEVTTNDLTAVPTAAPTELFSPEVSASPEAAGLLELPDLPQAP